MSKIVSLLFSVLVISFTGHAQDTTRTQRDLQLQQLLGMSNTEYKGYKDTLRQYDKRLTTALADQSLDKNARGEALAKALKERKGYIQQRLSQEQRQKLYEFNRQNAPVSPRIKQQKELEERLKQKGITVKAAD